MSLADRLSEMRKGTEDSQRKERKEPRVTPVQYIREVWDEMKKVSWPKRQDVVRGTVNVIIISAFIAVLLGAFDLVSKMGLEYILVETGVSAPTQEAPATGTDTSIEDLPFDVIENEDGSIEIPGSVAPSTEEVPVPTEGQ